jgi:hypothetical protein
MPPNRRVQASPDDSLLESDRGAVNAALQNIVTLARKRAKKIAADGSETESRLKMKAATDPKSRAAMSEKMAPNTCSALVGGRPSSSICDA